jgi:Icc-related predicted phosphoesterase
LRDNACGGNPSSERSHAHSTIPAHVDVLITHEPPHGILDSIPGARASGCTGLLDAINQVKPRLCVFGHIHGAHAVTSNADTVFVNAALLGFYGDLDEAPIVLRLPCCP